MIITILLILLALDIACIALALAVKKDLEEHNRK